MSIDKIWSGLTHITANFSKQNRRIVFIKEGAKYEGTYASLLQDTFHLEFHVIILMARSSSPLQASDYISTFLSSTARWLHIVGLQYRPSAI